MYHRRMKRLLAGCLLFCGFASACGSPPRAVPSLTVPLPRALATTEARPPAPAPAPIEPPYDGPTSGIVGDHAPLVGKVLAATRGKVVIVHVWASWCSPCADVLPDLQKVHAKYNGSGLAVVGISVDDEQDDARGFAKSHGVTFPIAWDDDKEIVGKWKPTMMPTTYVVDRAGIVRHVHAGFTVGDTAAIVREAEALL